MTAPELLPCPFCGCTTILPKKTAIGYTFHYCDWCGVEGPFEGVFDGITQGWNTRAPVSAQIAAAVQAEREACANVLEKCLAEAKRGQTPAQILFQAEFDRAAESLVVALAAAIRARGGE